MSKPVSTPDSSIDHTDWEDRLQLGLSLAFQLGILAVLVGTVARQRWQVAFAAAIFFGLTFLPAAIERHWRVHLPVEFTLVNCLFLFAAFVLGEVGQFYERFWWWDLMLHSLAALVLGLIGFLLTYAFYRTQRIQMAPIYVAIVSFGFAVTLGTIWEIFEFLMDQSLGLNMQRSGLVDTMTDLLVSTLGALVAAWGGYHYVKGGDSMFADRIVKRFVAMNPQMFHRRRRR